MCVLTTGSLLCIIYTFKKQQRGIDMYNLEYKIKNQKDGYHLLNFNDKNVLGWSLNHITGRELQYLSHATRKDIGFNINEMFDEIRWGDMILKESTIFKPDEREFIKRQRELIE